MGNKLTNLDQQQNDLINFDNEICPKIIKNNQFNSLPNNLSNNQIDNQLIKNSINLPKSTDNLKQELNDFGIKKKLFYLKKKRRKTKLDNLNSNILNDLIVKDKCLSDLTTKSVHIQVGNGLISLKNLNHYLESDNNFHLVNQIIKRFGVLNQFTQTDFEPLNNECMKIIEISSNLVDQLDNLNLIRPTIEEDLDEDEQRTHEGFNIVHYGKSNLKKNTRNVCIQRSLNKVTIGTQTTESIAYLIIIEILNRLNKIEEINKFNNNNEFNYLDNRSKLINNNLKEEEEQQQQQQKKDSYFNYFKSSFKLNFKPNLNNLKRKSDTFILNNKLINDLHLIYKTKFKSQPTLDNNFKNNKSLNFDDDNELNMDKLNLINKINEINQESDFLSMDKHKLEEYLKNLLLEVQLSQEHQKKVKSRSKAIQTINWTTDDIEYAARCPSLRKKELIYSNNLFDEIDKKALEAPKFTDLNQLTQYLTCDCKNDIFKVRAIFRWITNNMSFDWKYIEEQHKKIANQKSIADEQELCTEFNNNIIKEEDEDEYLKDEYLQNVYIKNDELNQNTIELIYQTRLGGSKEFCELFIEMCRTCEIKCKLIQGFAKNYYYRPGHIYLEDDINNLINRHHWLAVFVLGNWHLIDITWSTGYTDPVGKFQRFLNEFFFFIDPEKMIWTHFPISKSERDYEKWQLLDRPIDLDSFNNLPKVTANFFDLNLKIRSKIANPVTFQIQTEVKISAHEPIRYKYKLYHVDELENSSLNNFVFCQLKQERLVCSFVVSPPISGRYYFKIYAKSEKDLQDQNPANASLHYILTMLLECTKARKYQNCYPLNDYPYGCVQAFYNFQLKLINQNSAIISTFGGKRKLMMQCREQMLMTYHIQDADGQEQDTRTMISRDDENSTNVITLNILPPREGMFKLSIFGMPRLKPNQRGKCRLPLLATFLIDCRLAKIRKKQNTDPEPVTEEQLIDSLAGKKIN